MSQPRETVIVPIPYEGHRTLIEVYYKDPDKPERRGQVAADSKEAKIRLAEGAKLDECMVLLKQLRADNSVAATYLLCDGHLEPFNAEVHKLGDCCQEPEPEDEPEPEYEPIDEVFEDEDDIEDELLVEDEDDGVQDEAEEPAEDEYQGWGEEVDEEIDEEEVTEDDEDNETVDEDTPST